MYITKHDKWIKIEMNKKCFNKIIYKIINVCIITFKTKKCKKVLMSKEPIMYEHKQVFKNNYQMFSSIYFTNTM